MSTFLPIVMVVGVVSCGGDAEPAPFDLVATEGDIVSAVAEATRAGDSTVLSSPTTFAATVSISDEALPEEVESKDLTAEVLTLDSEKDGVTSISFVLGPDGATFAEPALLEWDGPWSKEASFSLTAFEGDGTPIGDATDPAVNSIAALGIEPTSANTAHYTLPVDHFSVWSVQMSLEHRLGPTIEFKAGTSFDEQIPVDETRTLTMNVSTSSPWAEAQCGYLQVDGTSGPVTAISAPDPICVDEFQEVELSAGLSCSKTGVGRVDLTVFAILLFGAGPIRGFSNDPEAKMDTIRSQMLRSSWQLTELDEGMATSVYDLDTEVFGGMFASSASFEVACVDADAATTTITSTTIGETTTTSTNAPTTSTTQPRATTTTKPPIATTTTTTSPVTTTKPTTTTMVPTTTTTTIPTTTSTTADWGPPGAWAYNDYVSCDWNDTGGCGWYWYDEISMTMGPIGGPGDTWP